MNHYSYFRHQKVTGPKSIIELLRTLKIRNAVINVCIPKATSINFPYEVALHNLSWLNILKLTFDTDIIIVDRHFFILGWFLSKLFRKKLCVRLLGLGQRLNSNRLLSKKNLIRFLTRISAVNLVISTLDASAAERDIDFIRSNKTLHRINGIDKKIVTNINIKTDESLLFFVGRDSPEKGLKEALELFSNIDSSSKRLDVFGSNRVPEIYKELVDSGIVRLHGFCDREKIENFTQRHAIMISGNMLGALGNAELEAIASGKYILYCGPAKYLSYLPIELRDLYSRDYSELLQKLNIRNIDDILFCDFETIHQNDACEILSMLP